MTGDKNEKHLNADAICKGTCGGTRIKVGGFTDLQSKDLKGKKYSVWIVVAHLNANPSMSLQAIKDLGIISFPSEDVRTIDVKGWLKDEIIEENHDVFDGFGCLEGTYSITIKGTIELVSHLPRKVPI